MPSTEEKAVFAFNRFAALIRKEPVPPAIQPGLDVLLRQRIDDALTTYAPMVGDWEIVWGPTVATFAADHYAVNTLFVAHNLNDTGTYVIATAGTNPYSWIDFVFEDALVFIQVDWPYAGPGKGKMALGTAIGLAILQGLVPDVGFPGAGKDLFDFLFDLTASTTEPALKIWTTGHSLGGALSPALAQWLHDTKPTWDPTDLAEIWTLPTAGPSLGDSTLSTHFSTTIADRVKHHYGDWDYAPNAWTPLELDRLNTIYTPPICRSLIVWLLVRLAKLAASAGDYTDLQSPVPPFGGAVNTSLVKWWKLPITNYLRQIEFQHINEYATYFDYTYPLPEMLPDHNPPRIGFWQLMSPNLRRAVVRSVLRPNNLTRLFNLRAHKVRLPAGGRVHTINYPPHPDYDGQVGDLLGEINQVMNRRRGTPT